MQFHLFSHPETWSVSGGAIIPVLASFAVGTLAPSSAMVENLELPFDPARIAEEVFNRRDRQTVSVTLQSRAATYFLTFARGNTLGLAVWGRIHGTPDEAEVIAVISSIAEATQAAYGLADTNIDSGKEPLVNNPFASLCVSNVYWLNLFGPGMSAPPMAGERRNLAYGGVIILTSKRPNHDAAA